MSCNYIMEYANLIESTVDSLLAEVEKKEDPTTIAKLRFGHRVVSMRGLDTIRQGSISNVEARKERPKRDKQAGLNRGIPKKRREITDETPEHFISAYREQNQKAKTPPMPDDEVDFFVEHNRGDVLKYTIPRYLRDHLGLSIKTDRVIAKTGVAFGKPVRSDVITDRRTHTSKGVPNFFNYVHHSELSPHHVNLLKLANPLFKTQEEFDQLDLFTESISDSKKDLIRKEIFRQVNQKSLTDIRDQAKIKYQNQLSRRNTGKESRRPYRHYYDPVSLDITHADSSIQKVVIPRYIRSYISRSLSKATSSTGEKVYSPPVRTKDKTRATFEKVHVSQLSPYHVQLLRQESDFALPGEEKQGELFTDYMDENIANYNNLVESIVSLLLEERYFWADANKHIASQLGVHSDEIRLWDDTHDNFRIEHRSASGESKIIGRGKGLQNAIQDTLIGIKMRSDKKKPETKKPEQGELF